MTWGEAANMRFQERQCFLTPTRIPVRSRRSADMSEDYSNFFTSTPPSSKETRVCPAAPRRNWSHEDAFIWGTASEQIRTTVPKLMYIKQHIVCPANPRRKRIIRYTPSESEETNEPLFEPRTPKRKRSAMSMSLAW